ncbi:MAG: ABC transporter substrate-binding protein [Microbacteriaceae bacterium]|nr:ABC transporter substrate-binding protein [Microbacteriaceae bacterium]
MRVPRFATAAIGLVAVASLLLSGCTASDDGDQRAIVTVNGTEPQNPLTPGDTTELGGYRIMNALFAGLVFYDASGTAVDDLAESIAPNADNTVYTISISDDSTFTDGEEVTAESFVNAWDWAALAKHSALNRKYFSEILGYSDEPKKEESLIEAGGLVVVDDHTFEVHLKTPQSDFPDRLGHIAFAPLPSAFYADPEGFAAHPIGNGPYMFDGADAWTHGKRLELVVNPGYEGKREPANDGITMRFYDSLDIAYADLLSGHLDVLDTIPASALPTFKEELGRRWIDQPTATLEAITIPARLAHFAGQEGLLRRVAISQAIDRQKIVDSLFGVTKRAAKDFTSPALDGWSDNVVGNEVLVYNSGNAKANWAKADEMSPWEGTFEIAYNADGDHGEWAEAVAASLRAELGIDAAAVAYPTLADLRAAIEDGSIPTAYRTNWRADYPGVVDFIVPLYSAKGIANFQKFSSPAFEVLLKKGASAKSQTDAAAAYKDAQEVLLAELPALPLWNSSRQAGYGESVTDVALDWQGVPQYYLITKHTG